MKQLFLAVIICTAFGNSASATCSKSPKDIVLNEASFGDTKINKFSVSAVQVSEKTGYQAMFNIDGDGFFYSDEDEKWCMYDRFTAPKRPPITFTCLEKVDNFDLMSIDDTKKTGVVAVRASTKILYVYSIDAKKEIDKTKPYLMVEPDNSSSENSAIDVKAMVGDKELGSLNFTAIKKGTPAELEKKDIPSEGFNLDGNKIHAYADCKKSEAVGF